MTNEEILEAQKLIAGMRDVLSALSGTTNADKLIAAVEDKMPVMIEDAHQLFQLLKSTVPPFPNNPLEWDDQTRHVSHLISEVETVQSAIDGAIQMAKRYDARKATLIETIAKWVSHVNSALDKIAQVLREKRQ